MTMTETNPRLDRTRRALLVVATDLMSKDSRASLGEIAAAAGVGRTTLHRYFPTRDALVHALADEALSCVAEAIERAAPHAGSPVAALRRVIAELVDFGPYLRFLSADPVVYDSPDLTRRWYDAFEPVARAVERGQAEGSLRADLPVDWIVDLLGGAVITARDSVLDGRLAARDAARVVSLSVLAGIAVTDAP